MYLHKESPHHSISILEELHLSYKVKYSIGSVTPCKSVVEFLSINEPSTIPQIGTQATTSHLELESFLLYAQ